MKKHSKMYVEAQASVDKNKEYDVSEAIKLLKSLKTRKFDETVDLALNLNIDAKKTDMNVRGSFVLPNGTGKTQKVAVVAEGDKAKEAQDAGADFVGGQELIDQISGGWFDFDVLVATPNLMGKLGRLGRVLGPKGLMPNPKSGTVTMDVANAVDEIKKGKVTYRVDRDGNLNIMIGKVSFEEAQIVENFNAIYTRIVKARPSTVKGTYMRNCVLTSTMGPAIHITME